MAKTVNKTSVALQKVPTFVWKILIILIGVGLGTAYYYNMSLSIPTESNCSFSANIWTDILAFIVGFMILIIGFRIGSWESYVLMGTGTVIIVEHIWQLVHNKIKPRNQNIEA
jgi:hypothetical protein